ncbi:Uncharacterised protein [Mycobacteroides abscessus subsp. abscessus]|nr:Uncharacterised protein [Mycobacteroides abscessus subsp. abscessus]
MTAFGNPDVRGYGDDRHARDESGDHRQDRVDAGAGEHRDRS